MIFSYLPWLAGWLAQKKSCCPKLTKVSAADCLLHGPIPDWIMQRPKIKEIEVSRNFLDDPTTALLRYFVQNRLMVHPHGNGVRSLYFQGQVGTSTQPVSVPFPCNINTTK